MQSATKLLTLHKFVSMSHNVKQSTNKQKPNALLLYGKNNII